MGTVEVDYYYYYYISFQFNEYVFLHKPSYVILSHGFRTLGCAASIISERKNVQHNVLKSLDSNDAVEVEAAIYAAMHFAEQSK